MYGTRNYVVLLLFGELIEVYCIARNPYRKLGIFFGMSLRVEKRIAIEHVYVEVMPAVFYVGVYHIYKVIHSVRHFLSPLQFI